MKDFLGLILLLGGPVLWVLWYLTAQRMIMTRIVLESSTGKCEVCGYSKDGLASTGVCPECGTSLRVRFKKCRVEPAHIAIVVLCAIVGGLIGAVFVCVNVDLSEDAQAAIALLFGVPIIGAIGSAVGAWLALGIIALKRHFGW